METDALESEGYVEEPWDCIEGQCYACDGFAPLDDLSLCDVCRAKLERDLIRQRDWDYSTAAFGLSDEGREEMRRQVAAQYGKDLELIAPPGLEWKKPAARRRRRRGQTG
jgi:hypothetical protein